MRRVLILLTAALAACAAQRTPGPNGIATKTDCAVISALLSQHYQIRADSPYRLDRGDGPRKGGEPRFRIPCEFPGIPIKTYDHKRPQTPPPNFQSWIKIQRPSYPDPDTAQVDAGSLLGPLAGSGVKCTLTRESENWRVRDCKMTWIS